MARGFPSQGDNRSGGRAAPGRESVIASTRIEPAPPAEELTDARLVQGCVEGQAACWDLLYRRFHGHVRRVVAWPRWRLTPAEVDDCVQEVFIELVRALRGFRGDAALGTFVTRLAKNRCVSHIRRKTAQKRAGEELGYALEERKGGEEEPTAIAVDGAPLPEEQLVAREEAAGVLRGLRELSDDCQTILRLRYFNDCAYDEICTRLSLPLGTVCSRLKRCLDRLRKVLAA